MINYFVMGDRGGGLGEVMIGYLELDRSTVSFTNLD